MDANDENKIDELQRVKKRIRKYTSRYARVRDQIGEEEWNRLVRLERLLGSLVWIFFSSVLLGIYYLFLRRLRFSPSFHFAPLDLVDELILISIPISFCALLMIRKLRNNALDSLEWHGKDPEKIESALLLEEEARSWEEAIPEITAEDQLLKAKAAGPPWWRVELSGLHLVLWICVLLALSGLVKNNVIPEKFQQTATAIAIIGWVIKICCWYLWSFAYGSAQTKLWLLQLYRSCGTLRGSATFIAILVLSVFLIGLICWLISLFFQ
jgi:hypothetical protein